MPQPDGKPKEPLNITIRHKYYENISMPVADDPRHESISFGTIDSLAITFSMLEIIFLYLDKCCSLNYLLSLFYYIYNVQLTCVNCSVTICRFVYFHIFLWGGI